MLDILSTLGDWFSQLLQIIFHIDKFLQNTLQPMGLWVYVLLFVIIFCETGLVIFPFLPGDSLLFVTGSFAAVGMGELSLFPLLVTIAVAAFLGNAVNYEIGRAFGRRLLARPGRLIRREHIEKTQAYFDKRGPIAITISRFMPIIRTFMPFIAGLGQMSRRVFTLYNLLGAVGWTLLMVLPGYFFGRVPLIKDHFSETIYLIIFISLLPAIIEFIRGRIHKKKQGRKP